MIKRKTIANWAGLLAATGASAAMAALPPTPRPPSTRPARTQPASVRADEPTTRPIGSISITLSEKNVSAARLMDDLAAQCQGRLTFDKKDLPAGDAFSIDLNQEPFWPAMRKVGLLLDMDYIISDDGGVSIVAGKGGFALTSASPWAILKAQHVRWIYNQPFDVAERAGQQSMTCGLTIGLAASPDELLGADIGNPIITKLVDEQGHEYKDQAQFSGDVYYNYGRSQRVSREQNVLSVGVAASDMGKRIVELSGHFTIEVGQELTLVTVPLATRKAMTIQLKHMKVEFSNIQNQANGITGQLEIISDGDGPNVEFLKVALQEAIADDDGSPMVISSMAPANGKSPTSLVANFSFRANFTGTVAAHPELKLNLPQSSKSREITFSFKNIPLP